MRRWWLIGPTLLIMFGISCSSSARFTALTDAIRQTGDIQVGTHVVKIDQLFDLSLNSNKQREFIYFLQRFILDHPTDPYRTYEEYLIANAYRTINEPELSRYAFEQTLKIGPDVVVQNESIQRKTLQLLIDSEKNPFRSIGLREMLLQRFANNVSQGPILYELGFLYETIGAYQRAYDTFKTVLTFPQTTIPGKTDPLQRIRERLLLYDTKRDWGQPSIDVLLKLVKQAIRSRDTEALVGLQAKINFFAMSWLQERADPNAVSDFDIRKFSLDTVSFEDQIESNSNAREAFLKTSGWSTYIPIWYLYFRKVDFPADPEYNGTWEWAGVYFGDTIQEIPLSRGL